MRDKALATLKRLLIELAKTPPTQPKRLSVPFPTTSGLFWLAANPQMERSWWADRDRKLTRAGLGIADLIMGIFPESLENIGAKLEEKTAKNSELCYRGGIRFPSTNSVEKAWENFGYYRFTLPLFELLKNETGTYLLCYWVPNSHMSAQDQLQLILTCLDGLHFQRETPLGSGHVLGRHDHPVFDEWERRIAVAKDLFHQSVLDKVVLARRTTFEWDTPIDPVMLLDKISSPYSDAGLYQFLFQSGPQSCFMGVSPERLFRRFHRSLYTEALAGTQPANQPPDHLLTNPNAIDEHQWVSKMITEAIAPLCEPSTHFFDKRVVVLPRVAHLFQPFQSELKPGVTDGQILKALFPTPAVAGYPVSESLKILAATEGFDRGWYSGVVGIWSQEETHLAVAIRSALVDGKTLHIYTGAGIIPGSNPQAEWKELNDKMAPFTEAIDALHR